MWDVFRYSKDLAMGIFERFDELLNPAVEATAGYIKIGLATLLDRSNTTDFPTRLASADTPNELHGSNMTAAILNNDSTQIESPTKVSFATIHENSQQIVAQANLPEKAMTDLVAIRDNPIQLVVSHREPTTPFDGNNTGRSAGISNGLDVANLT